MSEIYLTSFLRSKNLPEEVVPWSGAVYQPKGFSFPKADWADIRDGTGDWIRPRRFADFPTPRLAYRAALLDHYGARKTEAVEWLNANSQHKLALVCWCPYERAAIRQLKDWGSFICHLSVAGEFLSTLNHKDGLEENWSVWYDADRLSMTVLTQKSLQAPAPLTDSHSMKNPLTVAHHPV
jgi:hypothetical protein